MMKFSTASYTSPIFTANRHQKRKSDLNNQQDQINNETPTTKRNKISSKLKTGALVSTAFLAGLGLNYQINSCSNQEANENKPKIEQITTKESPDSIEAKHEKVFEVKDSLINNKNKQDSIEEDDDNKKEIKKEKTQAPKSKKTKTQPKEKSKTQNTKKQTEVTDEDMERMFMEMMFE